MLSPVPKPFDQFWQEVITALDKPRKIRNWTPYNGYTVGGHFIAISYRALDGATQKSINRGYPYEVPDNWIVCTQVKGEGTAHVSRKEFRDRYLKWRDYRNNGMTRLAFGGGTTVSPYLISIFHEFDSLIGA